MKTKLFVFLIIFSNYQLGYTTQRYLLTSSEKKPIWLEISKDFSYFLVDINKSYKLFERKGYIFEGAHLLESSEKSRIKALLLGFKTIASSRDLRLTAYEFAIDTKGIIKTNPKQLDYLNSLIFEAGRLVSENGRILIKEEIKEYGSSVAKRDGEQLPLLKEYKVRYQDSIQLSVPKWPIPLSSLDYLNLAHAMKSLKFFKKSAALYTIGLNQQNRHLNILDNYTRQQIHFDFAQSLLEAGYPKRAKTVLKSLGSRLKSKSRLRTPVFKLYKRVLKELGED
tara:strand:- start:407 stop:1249 length:843 start_codon:yes stop_codon:yes gene_type:complete